MNRLVLTVEEARAILEALKFQYINRTNDDFYRVLSRLEKFVEENQ